MSVRTRRSCALGCGAKRQPWQNLSSVGIRCINQEFPEIGSLEEEDARAAIEIPGRDAGVEFAADALDELVRASQGYPYFLQEWGYHVWNHALGSPVPLSDVQAVRPLVLSALDRDFLRRVIP